MYSRFHGRKKSVTVRVSIWRGHNGSEKTYFCTFDKKPLEDEEIHCIGGKEEIRIGAREIRIVTHAQSDNQQAILAKRRA